MFKVLIVEDDPMVAMINEQYINKNENFKVVGKVRDGKSALEYLEKNSVDLVVMDVYMPKLNGLETLREIRNRRINIEAIMVTAANDRENFEEALRLGIVDYLVKPFNYERFQMALDKFYMQNKALEDMDMLSQNSIDYIIENSRRKTADTLPKGIQEKTLNLIINILRDNKGVWLNGDEIAYSTGLTSVTVRRYLTYLSDSGRIESQMNYDTGGRPSMNYRI